MGCCFGAENKGADCPNGTEPRDYGSTEKQALVITDQPQPVDGATEGSAYAYEEHESSSDSEDEDLKRFNQARNSRRSNSVRSAGIDKGVIATEHEEVKQYDNQAYQLDTPSNIGSTEMHHEDLRLGYRVDSPRDTVDSWSIAPSDSVSRQPSRTPSLAGRAPSVTGRAPSVASGSSVKGKAPSLISIRAQSVVSDDKTALRTPSDVSVVVQPTLVEIQQKSAPVVVAPDHVTRDAARPPSDQIAKSVISGNGQAKMNMDISDNGKAKLNVDESQSRSSFDCSIVSLKSANSDIEGDLGHEEHLFDVSDLTHDPDAQLISKCGQLEVTFNYQQENCKMHITVNHAKDIPSKDRGGANSTQIRLLLLPTKKQRHKTKIKTGEHPVFEETFTFKVPPDAVGEMGIRMRLYGCERMRRERMIGESVVGFASLNLEQATTHLLTLEPRANISHGDSKLDVSSLSRSDSASSSQSMQHGGMPELLVGLAYNGTTGRLSVEVIKGSNFRNMAMQRAPDTYVKLTLMSANGQEIARSKTSIRRGQPNPLYKETFMFQVALFQLPDVTLMVSVYNKRSMKRKEMIGWFSSGLNSSGEEELSHWKDMVDSKGEQVCRWHVLLEA